MCTCQIVIVAAVVSAVIVIVASISAVLTAELLP